MLHSLHSLSTVHICFILYILYPQFIYASFFTFSIHGSCMLHSLHSLSAVHIHVCFILYILYPQFIYSMLYSYTSFVILSLSQEHVNSQLTLLPMCGFIAQLIEHHTGNTELMGSNPIEALNFFWYLCNCLNCKQNFEDHFFYYSNVHIIVCKEHNMYICSCRMTY